MKRILLLGVVFISSSILVFGQMNSKEIAELAKEEAASMALEGWKPKAGGLPLRAQLAKSYTMLEETVNGKSKYIIAEGQVKGTTFEIARVHAMEVAKRNMISLIDNVSLTETEGDMISVDGSEAVEGEALSETKYKNASALDLGDIITVMTCYRQLPGEGTVEVMVQLAVTRDNVVKAKLKRARNGQNAGQSQNSAPKIEASHTL